MKLLLCGDLCPTETTAPLFDALAVDALFGDVRTLFDQSDFSFVNLECALTDSENRIRKFGPNLKGPKNTAKVLKELGVDLCGLSNNHIFDFGAEGAADTLQVLEDAGIGCTGFGKNYDDSRTDYILEKGGERIAFIAVCEHEFSYSLEDRMGSRPYDPYDTMADIRKARASCDTVVVIYHGGKEYCRYPSPRVYKLCRAMVDNGADIVLCQHSHCIATYENYRGGHILHGQGNFHFVKQHSEDCWYTSLATVYDTETKEVTFVPIACGEKGIRMATGREGRQIMDAFHARNRELADGSWYRGWHTFCQEKSEIYRLVIQNACADTSTERQNAHFAHYLDCEAHTDVWRELFPTYNQTNEK